MGGSMGLGVSPPLPVEPDAEPLGLLLTPLAFSECDLRANLSSVGDCFESTAEELLLPLLLLEEVVEELF